MFCNNCGTEIKEGVMFCPNCGNKVDGGASQAWEDARTVIWGGNADAVQESRQAVAGEENVAGAEAAADANAASAEGESSAATETEAATDKVSVEEGAAGAETVVTPVEMTGIATAVQGENTQRKFCPNCGTENGIDDIFCKECGMNLQGLAYNVSAAGPGMQANVPLSGQTSKKRKGLIIGIGAAAVVLVLVIAIAVAAVGGLFTGPGGKVLKATIATMKDAPEIVNDLKIIPDIMTGNQYTVGVTMEYDGDAVSGEFRNTVKDKQIYAKADVDGEDLDFLCGVHSGVLKASVSDLDYVFVYDPKGENDGFLSKQIRKKQLKEFNSVLENITTEKVTVKELQKDFTAAFVQEFKELEFKEAKSKEFEVDKKDRECKGYKVRINEKNIAHVLENAGDRISKRLAEDVVDDFEDTLEDLVDEIENDDFDMDITFYLYKNKLAGVIFGMKNWGQREYCIKFQGGDYRMQNVEITYENKDTVYEMLTISTRKKGSKETVEMDSDGEDIIIIYDTKSGKVSLEYDSRQTDCLIEGTYKKSGSEVSFALEEFEVDGKSLVEDKDFGFTVYAGKEVKIEKYNGKEFNIGTADKEDFEDLADDLEDYIDLLSDMMDIY